MVYNYKHLNISSFPWQACLPGSLPFSKTSATVIWPSLISLRKKHKHVLLPVVAQKTEPNNLLSVSSPSAASTVQTEVLDVSSALHAAQRLQRSPQPCYRWLINTHTEPQGISLFPVPPFLPIKSAPNLSYHKTLSRLHLDYYSCADAPLESAVQNNKRKLHAFAVGIQAKWKWVSETKRSKVM